MVSSSVSTSAHGLVKYHAAHLSQGDYYSQGGETLGVYTGNLATMMGIEGQAVTAENFAQFAELDLAGLSHGLVQDRPNSSKVKAIDFTYSAPKAVSIAAVFDDRVKAELFCALKEELAWFEENAAARERRGEAVNTEQLQATGNWLAAMFQHETSRTNDADFHVHVVVANATYHPERDQMLAMQYADLLALKKTLDSRVNNNLAARLERLGYRVEVAKHGFGLREVSPELETEFSQRSVQMRNVKQLLSAGYMASDIAKILTPLSPTAKNELLKDGDKLRERVRASGAQVKAVKAEDYELDEQAVKLTRPDKERITSETLRESHKRRMEEKGLTFVKPDSPTPPAEPAVDLPTVIEQAQETTFKTEAVVRLDTLLGEVVRLAPGQFTNAQVAEALRADDRFSIGHVTGKTGEMVTTKTFQAAERHWLSAIEKGQGACSPLVDPDRYEVPAHLLPTPENISKMVEDAQAKGEELTPELAKESLRQFAEIDRYVSTSPDRFLNIRGGAGVGKTFNVLVTSVEKSLAAGRPVALVAPYGNQSRGILRGEADRLERQGKHEVAKVFRQANTVAALLMKAANQPEFKAALKGADIYCDEGSLLDTDTASRTARLVQDVGGRFINVGDTEQMQAVGRGAPVREAEKRLGWGMHVARADVSRRQRSREDKELARDLSSGDDARFNRAVDRLIDRGNIREVDPVEARNLAADRIIEARRKGGDLLVVSSIHRIANDIADKVHERHVAAHPDASKAFIVALKDKELQPLEMLSSRSYAVGNGVDWTSSAGRELSGHVVAVDKDGLTVESGTRNFKVPFHEVTGVYDRREIERAVGEYLLLTEKIKQNGKQFERNSRHQITGFDETGNVLLKSGLKLPRNDGRVMQADVLTTHKAQGAKALHTLGVETNQSAAAMGNKNAAHVEFTRHVERVEMLVENVEVFREAIQRNQTKSAALDLVPAIKGPTQKFDYSRYARQGRQSVRQNRAVKLAQERAQEHHEEQKPTVSEHIKQQVESIKLHPIKTVQQQPKRHYDRGEGMSL